MFEKRYKRSGQSAGVSFLAATALLLAAPAVLQSTAQAQSDDVVKQLRARPQESKKILTANKIEWCGTDQDYKRRYPQRAARATGTCAVEGPPDLATNRDAAIPIATTPFKTIRVKFNIFARNDGSSPVATQGDVDGQLAQLNADYAPARIRFVSTGTRIINSTRFRDPVNITTEIDAMKSAYADQPAKQINVYVFEAGNAAPNLLGVGTFAWLPDATSAGGGFFCDNDAFGAGEKTATHELGHCLGLWHPFHGVDETQGCEGCRELAGRSVADGNITGDFCADTPAEPKNFSCGSAPGSDACNGATWGTTDFKNFMGYANDTCVDHFTPQQMGRMHAWIQYKLSGWLVGADAADAPTVSGSPVGSTLATKAVATFSKPMNPASVQAAFKIAPDVAGTFAWSNNNQTVTFTPNVAFANGTTYQVSIIGSAQAADGKTLDGNLNEISEGSPADDYSWTFRRPGAPSNDNWAQAQAVTGITGTKSGFNTDSTKEAGEPVHYSGTNVYSSGYSVWYKWTAPSIGNANFRLASSDFGAIVAVYTGPSVGTLESVGSTFSEFSGVSFRTKAGMTYYIAIDSATYYDSDTHTVYPPETGDFALNWRFITSPSGDLFVNAKLISGATGSVTGSNHGAYYEDNEPYHNGRYSSMWYKWTAPANGALFVNTGGSAFDTNLAVFQGTTIGGLTELAEDNDSGAGTLSFVKFTVVAGKSYYIALGGTSYSFFDETRGDYKMSWNLQPAPPNDLYTNAQLISGTTGRVLGTNVGANVEANEPDHGAYSSEASVWYKWIAPGNGSVTITTGGSTLDTTLAVYQKGGIGWNTLTLIDENDNVSSTVHTSKVTFTTVGNREYRIAISNGYAYTFDESHGKVVLNWALTPAPANDMFAAAQALTTASGRITATNLGANIEATEPDHGGYDSQASVWYKWTAPGNGDLTINTAGSIFDTGLAVYKVGDTGFNGLIKIAENDNISYDNATSLLDFTAEAGVTYYIAVATANDYTEPVSGKFNLNWVFTPAPANDMFEAAQVISGVSGHIGGSNFAASVEDGEPDHGGYNTQASVWYKWTAPANGVLVIDTAGSAFNTSLAVYAADGDGWNSLRLVVDNDDITYEDDTSRLGFTAQAGVTYYIALATGNDYSDPPTGAFNFNWAFTPAPRNDMFSAAQEISGASGRVSGSNLGATIQRNEPEHGYYDSQASIWYKWTAPASGKVIIDTVGSAIDTTMAVYTGDTVGGLTWVADNDDISYDNTLSRLNFNAQAGVVYKIAIALGGDWDEIGPGNITLSWSLAGAAILTPSIKSFSPLGGAPGATVTVTGTNFVTGATTVKFGSLDAEEVTVNSATQLTATVPPLALSAPISISTANGTGSSATTFIVVPRVSALTPKYGAVGDVITLSGSNFGGATAVRFNGLEATNFTVISPTKISVVVPVNATTGKISVSNMGGTGTSTGIFTVAPRISSFSPASGPVGTIVTINGANFKAPTVKFNGVAVSTVTVVSSIKLKATVPAGATTGLITITTTGGTATSATPFTVANGLTSTPTVVAQAGSDTDAAVRSSAASASPAVPASPVALSAASVQATDNSVQIVFGGVLDPAVAKDPAHYTVKINGQVVAVESATYEAGINKVTLLAKSGVLHVGDEAVISWHDLRDAQQRVITGQVGPVAVR